MAFMTMNELKKKTTAPITMPVFEQMLQGKPIEFTDNGQTYAIPIGEDVKKTVEALMQLVDDGVAEKAKIVDTPFKKLAVKYAQTYCKQYFDKKKGSDK